MAGATGPRLPHGSCQSPIVIIGPSKSLTALTLEQSLLAKPWKQVRPEVRVKLLPQDAELYVFAESRDRIAKERSMRRRQMKWLWGRLKKLATMKLTRDALLMKLGAAQGKTPAAWRLVSIEVAVDGASFVSVKPAVFFISRARKRTMSSRFTTLELSDGEDQSAAS